MASDTYHEPYELISPATKDRHRAITTLIEELEAIDWYQQRADVCGDEELKAVLIHNKNEEIEHAMMTLEWLRRNVEEFDANIRTYINAQGPITEIEATSEVAGNGGEPNLGGSPAKAQRAAERGIAVPSANGARTTNGAAGSLGIGSLKGA